MQLEDLNVKVRSNKLFITYLQLVAKEHWKNVECSDNSLR